jgi:hypothetical protein
MTVRRISRNGNGRAVGLQMALAVVKYRLADANMAANRVKLNLDPAARGSHWNTVERQCAMELVLVARAIQRLIDRECGASPEDDSPYQRALQTSSRGGVALCIPGKTP